jgi:hypothetical protein
MSNPEHVCVGLATLVVTMFAVWAIAIYFYKMGVRHSQPEQPGWAAKIIDCLEKRPDGLPEARTYPAGRVDPCLRCQCLTECGVVTAIGDPFTGRIMEGPICDDCYRMQFQDPQEFWPLMRTRVQEEFRGRDND